MEIKTLAYLFRETRDELYRYKNRYRVYAHMGEERWEMDARDRQDREEREAWNAETERLIAGSSEHSRHDEVQAIMRRAEETIRMWEVEGRTRQDKLREFGKMLGVDDGGIA